MKAQFETLKAQADQLTRNELMDAIIEFTNELVNTDNRLLSVDKQWKGYGTWKSVGFANEYHFGAELSEVLSKAISNHITHDEEKEFSVSEFSEEIQNAILNIVD